MSTLNNGQSSFSIDQFAEPDQIGSVAIAVAKQINKIQKENSCKSEVKNGEVFMQLTCNERYLKADLNQGALIAVAEITRNAVSKGATVKNLIYKAGLNDEWVAALKNAAIEFSLPISEGTELEGNSNLGLYGVMAEASPWMTGEFKSKGDLIFLIGESVEDISSSVYLATAHKIEESPAPFINVKQEISAQKSIRTLVEKELINSASVVSEGGVFYTLAQMSLPNELGFDIEADGEIRLDAFLFSESQGRALVTVGEEKEDEFIEFMSNLEVPTTLLGHVTKGKMVIDGEHYGFITDLK